jgi:hypothetical protein
MTSDPLGRPVAVVDGGREGVLRGEPVPDGDHLARHQIRQPATDAVGRVDAPERPTAAEEVHQRGQRPFTLRPIPTQRHSRVRHQILDEMHRLHVATTCLDGSEIGGASLFQRLRVELRRVLRRTLRTQLFDLGIQWHGVYLSR